jgi:hypothetical protein
LLYPMVNRRAFPHIASQLAARYRRAMNSTDKRRDDALQLLLAASRAALLKLAVVCPNDPTTALLQLAIQRAAGKRTAEG